MKPGAMVFAGLTLVLASGAPALFAEESASEASAVTEAVATDAAIPEERDDDELICRREKVMGSNIPVRVCRTRAQMRWDAANAQKSLSELGDSSSKSRGE